MTLYVGNTVLLLHGDGTNGSTTFTDVTGKSVTPYGNAEISTAQSKFGGAAMRFDGNGDYLSVPHSDAINLTAGDWTIELWVYLTALTSDHQSVVSKDGIAGSSYAQYDLAISPTGRVRMFVGNGNGVSPSGVSCTGATSIPLNTWTHVAAVKYGVNVLVFTGGTLDASCVAAPMYDGGKALLIGWQQGQGGGAYFNGYIDELCIVKGFAARTNNFTPPVAPLVYTEYSAVPSGFVTFGPPLSHYNPAVGAPVLHDKPTDLTDRLPFGVPNTPIVNNVNPWEFKGRGRITGTVKNTPATPVRRLLRLYREPGGLLVNSIWSDPDTGAYTFNGLHMGYRYTVVSFDHTQAFRAVVADRVIPEVTP